MMGKMIAGSAVAISAAAMLLGVPALAQEAMSAGAPPLPKCSAKVTDSCDQSKTSERYALTAAQADKTGGVGDRAANRAAPAKATPRHRMRHHRMRHHTATTTATTSAPVQ